MTSTAEARAAAEVLLPVLAPLHAELDPDTYGGAMLLGVDGCCIISHGSSSPTAIVNAVRVAAEMVSAGLVERLRKAVARLARPISFTSAQAAVSVHCRRSVHLSRRR